MGIEIKPVRSKKDLKNFIRLQWKIYKGNPNWVPPLISEVKKQLDKTRNPFFKRGEAEYFLAYKDNELVGRITAHIDPHHNERHKDKTGFFGFFETINDKNVAKALVEEAAKWLIKRGMNAMRGPCNFTMEDPWVGILVKGFDKPPCLNMAYSPPYYKEILENLGFYKIKDLNAYHIYKEKGLPKAIQEKAKKTREIPNFYIRAANVKDVYNEAKIIAGIFNESLKENWGFVPFTDKEIKKMAKNIKSIADPRIILIAYSGDKPIGSIINLPNLNEILIKMNGRLFPFGIFKFLLGRKKVKSLRGYALGVLKEYRKKGVGSALIEQTWIRAVKAGYDWAEITWILEDNVAMNELALSLGSEPVRIYRLYQKDL